MGDIVTISANSAASTTGIANIANVAGTIDLFDTTSAYKLGKKNAGNS